MPSQNKIEVNKSKNLNINDIKDVEQQGYKKKNRAHSLMQTAIILISILVMVVIIAGGVFYFIIKSDVNGIATNNRNAIIKIPILKTALPKPKDPEDPKYLSNTELVNKYNTLRKKEDELTNSLNEYKKKIDELQKYKSNSDAITASQDKTKSELDALKKSLDEEAIKNAEDKKKIDQLIASGNKDGFKAYYEKVNKDTAAEMYKQIVSEQAASEETQKLVKLYEGMDASAAAKILAEMQTNQFDLVIQILKNMNTAKASAIIAASDSQFAAKITAKLATTNN